MGRATSRKSRNSRSVKKSKPRAKASHKKRASKSGKKKSICKSLKRKVSSMKKKKSSCKSQKARKNASSLLSSKEMTKASSKRTEALIQCNIYGGNSDSDCDEKDYCDNLLDGTHHLTFQAENCKISVEINEETLFGKYRGAIKYSPITGMLHLCMGPIIKKEDGEEEGEGEGEGEEEGEEYRAERAMTYRGVEMGISVPKANPAPTDLKLSKRPLISMLIKDESNKCLYKWYLKKGKKLQRERFYNLLYKCSNATSSGYPYADLYGLPGATKKLSIRDLACIDRAARAKSINNGLEYLTQSPDQCPPFLENDNLDNSCYSRDYTFNTKDCCPEDDYDETIVLGELASKLCCASQFETESKDECKRLKKMIDSKKCTPCNEVMTHMSHPNLTELYITTDGLVKSLKAAELIYSNVMSGMPSDCNDYIPNCRFTFDDNFFLKVKLLCSKNRTCTLKKNQEFRQAAMMAGKIEDSESEETTLLQALEINRFDRCEEYFHENFKSPLKEFETKIRGLLKERDRSLKGRGNTDLLNLIGELLLVLFSLYAFRDIIMYCSEKDKVSKANKLVKVMKDSFAKSFRDLNDSRDQMESSPIKYYIIYLLSELKKIM